MTTSRCLRLLIVDDTEDYRFVLKELFKAKPDIDVTEAISGSDAIEKVRDNDYDLVLLDVRMPSATEGIDALSTIKALKPNIKVIMMSAYGDIPKAVEAMNRGALDFVDKENDFKNAVHLKVMDFLRTASLISDREAQIQTKYKEALSKTNIHEKGKALEELLLSLFTSIAGFVKGGANTTTETEEIDIVIINKSVDPLWQRESAFILVECKNWSSKKVGKNEFVLFKEKIENRFGRCDLGFLVCVETFADTVTKEMLRSSKSSLIVVPIDGEDLRRLVDSQNRSQLLLEFLQRAVMT